MQAALSVEREYHDSSLDKSAACRTCYPTLGAGAGARRYPPDTLRLCQQFKGYPA